MCRKTHVWRVNGFLQDADVREERFLHRAEYSFFSFLSSPPPHTHTPQDGRHTKNWQELFGGTLVYSAVYKTECRAFLLLVHSVDLLICRRARYGPILGLTASLSLFPYQKHGHDDWNTA